MSVDHLEAPVEEGEDFAIIRPTAESHCADQSPRSGNGTVAGDRKAKELVRYYDGFVSLPRDVLPHAGRPWALAAREVYLLITLYRMSAREDRPSVSCTPERLAGVTGISVKSLRRILGIKGGADEASDCVPPRLYPWLPAVTVRDNALGNRVWDLLLTPLDAAEVEGFLRVPHWWLWTEGWEPTLDLESRAWAPDDPGIHAALAIAHVGVGHRISRLGKQGLATVSGVSRATMTRALADAERKGWIRVEGTKGGPGRLGGRGGTGKAARVVMTRPSESWTRRNLG